MNVPSVSLVIPCYNESERLAIMFDGIEQFVKTWEGAFEIILIDDGSTDASEVLIKNHPVFVALERSKCIQFLHQPNLGKGGALRLGIEQVTKEFVLTLDADMASSPLELITWFAMRKGFYSNEILIGSRELKQSVIQELPFRKFVGNVFNFLIRKITGLPFLDTQCGFKLYPTETAKQLFSALKTLGWAHDVEVLMRANQLGIAIVEMPLHWKAVDGSKINVTRDAWIMLSDVIKIKRQLRHNWKTKW